MLGKKLPKGHYGPFGTKPAGASVFISASISILLNADSLAGIAMPARASVSNSIDILMNAEALAGFVPKGP